MIRELDRVVLTKRLDEQGLEAGDVGTIVLAQEGGRAFEVEFIIPDGETSAVTTVMADDVRPILQNEICACPCGHGLRWR